MKTFFFNYFIVATFSLITVSSCTREKVEQKDLERVVTYEELTKLYIEASVKLRTLYLERSTVQGATSNRNQDDFPLSTLLTEEEAIQILAPLQNPTAAYLQQQYDINIYDDIPQGDPRIAMIGGVTLRLEYLENVHNQTIDTATIETNSVYSRTNSPPDLFDCAMRSLGVEAAVELLNSGINSAAKAAIRKKALRKVITKVASRFLGPIGAAIAIYELGDCMEWW